MSTHEAGILKDSNFTIEREESATPGKLVLRFAGPLTNRSMYLSMSPDAVQSILDFTQPPGEAPTTVRIFDLTGVPYMDSMGLGFIMTQYTKCKGRGVSFIAAGVSPRVMELFRLTRMDTVLPIAPKVEDALAQ
jgi:anti-sigma B factor antagonist